MRLPPKTARYLLLAALILLPLGAWLVVPGLINPAPDAPNDAAVLRVVLEHFADHEDFLPTRKAAKKLILVHKYARGANQLSYPERGRIGPLLTTELYENLRERNETHPLLLGMRLGNEVVIVNMIDFLGDFEEKVQKTFPGPVQACHVGLWLPGYSPDGNTAFVKFVFGPASDGAHASYLLKKQGDAWVVSDYDIANHM